MILLKDYVKLITLLKSLRRRESRIYDVNTKPLDARLRGHDGVINFFL